MLKKVIALTLTFAAWTAAAESVVVGIAPVHSLAQAVMGNTGKAELIIPPDQSPHSVRLRPSQARLLQNAKLLFYISEEFERFMPAALRSLPPSVRAVSVLKGIDLLPYRDEDRDHDKHDDHEKHDDHDDDHSGHDDHGHGEYDLHAWLDPNRAKEIVDVIARELSTLHPDNQETYQANARRLHEKLTELDTELKTILSTAQGRSFAVMHDAYQYFELRYNLENQLSIRDHDATASAKRLLDFRRKSADITCLFGEKQIPLHQMRALIGGRDIKLGELDPLGADIPPGADLYFKMMRNLGRAFADCLSE